MNPKLAKLKTRLAPLNDIGSIMGLLRWDQETMMPPGGAELRASQLTTIGGIQHRMATDEELGGLLEDLNSEIDQWDFDSDEASTIRVNWRDFQKMVRIPTETYMAFLGTAAMATQTWREAREQSDFSLFQPHLEKLLGIEKELAERLDMGYADRYDALLDFYETDLTTGYVKTVFDGIKPQLRDLIAAIAERTEAVDPGIMARAYDVDTQYELSKQVAEALGFDFEKGRLDLSTHPFTGGAGFQDVRMTTRISADKLGECITSTIHETGHAIHFQQVNPALPRLGIEMPGLSTAESQSRFYENHIGLSRAFWTHYFPQYQAAFPDALGQVSFDDFYGALNAVQPGFIRIEADEVTYGMHIMLRFELEHALINGEMEVKDLPDAWSAKMAEYLGITPPDDAHGVLQDIHWSQMPMGYFPTYLLGSIFSAQLWETMQVDHPGIEAEWAQGQFGTSSAWLGEKVQQHGGKFTLPELVERATGRALSPDPYMSYLAAKYSAIYGL